eukprot:2233954-Rhodomonas_salina.1
MVTSFTASGTQSSVSLSRECVQAALPGKAWKQQQVTSDLETASAQHIEEIGQLCCSMCICGEATRPSRHLGT